MKKAEFKGSYPDYKVLPKSDLPEFAFIGRSNVGKSSLINMLCSKKDLAKTSSKPGKTQHIVQFLVDDKWYLVDLPGYGYAKISKDLRHQFGDMIQTYLMDRDVMNCVFVLLDSRLPPQKIDIEFIEWLGVSAIPFCLAFTKTDKLKPKELIDNIANYKAKLLETWEELPEIFITSANDKLGREEILTFIEGVIKTINSRERDF